MDFLPFSPRYLARPESNEESDSSEMLLLISKTYHSPTQIQCLTAF